MIPKTPDTQPNKKPTKLCTKSKTNFKNSSSLKTASSSRCGQLAAATPNQSCRPWLLADFHSQLGGRNFCCRALKLAQG